MTTPDLTGSPVSATETGPAAAGAFLPDVATIERLANAFFQDLSGGAPAAPPAIPASPPAPWSAPAPTSTAVAAAAPIQPPMGAVEPAANVPSSVPARSFGGASAGSASPFALPQSRAVAPAASQTAVAAPRVNPIQSAERSPTPVETSPESFPTPGAVSPFSAPLDLSAALAALAAATGLAPVPAVGFAAPGFGASGAPAPGPADVSRVSSVAPPPSTLAASGRPAPSFGPEGSPAPAATANGLRLGEGHDPTGYAAPPADASPFATPTNLDAVPRSLSGPPQTSAPADAGLLRHADAATAPPTAASAAAPSPAIAPVFTGASSGVRTYDAATIRNDFPILQEKVHGKRLIWLDNGATTQKPQAVIDRLAAFYAHENSNVHRGAHTLAARATDAYEAARDKLRRFVNASSTKEIVFVRGTTEGINLVAQSYGRRNVKAGDEIVVTWLEHHANIVPWQQLCLETGARLRVAPVDDNGDILLDEYEKLLGPKTRIVGLTMVSNALGTVTPAREMIAAAHRHGAVVVVDGAQSVAHRRTDVQALDADFFVLSGHKMFAPTGVGALYGKQAILETMPPWQGGGNMIADVTFERTVYQGSPERFEAGTGNIADAVGLGAAIDYLDGIGMESIGAHEHALIERTVAGLPAIPGVRLVGSPRERAGVVSFVVDGCRTEDVGKALDREGIAVRAGHHCAQPILRRFGLESTVRPSFALYNTAEDVEALLAAVRRIALRAQGGSR
ncbi:cysteine desulfurase/selenocysteine lyase [Roseiarcus fermentans]|uniref:cysteine desulfurase n=1 Tax=Roseiarcus fermentans TaxID=1473586 RepID=A0A366F6S2_9HYPH|nr:family 2A encapsulin nanocompartment cargo protein cysteine desulfurase [Roseiarcus fermentans]RBP09846.1 cysteine desulfurase/selenocysteine lyase [Roseiarcus fermentans]